MNFIWEQQTPTEGPGLLLYDIVRFRPDGTAFTMEPNKGWQPPPWTPPAWRHSAGRNLYAQGHPGDSDTLNAKPKEDPSLDPLSRPNPKWNTWPIDTRDQKMYHPSIGSPRTANTGDCP
ncbi:hypothetical protein AVEN_125267-1 [Araneus ventricosus]|uniref:Uncharacterized protein n=1 Tax=Araneus ventricosus TaxID=182803 RepID=A0A4Y2QI84_ARAVE|nr:hypothetical protein AVEN_125267-1 [Araneus ventricosus]